MTFKIIRITKKHILLCALSVSVLLSAIISFSYINNRAVPVFSEQQIYDDILKEGLSDDSENTYSVNNVLDKLLGFDITQSESIIEEFSPIYENNTPKQPQPTPTVQQTAPAPQIPTREQIMAFDGVEITNSTSYTINPNEFVGAQPTFDLQCDQSPEILIMHTHTTESFGDFGDRNADGEKNIVAVGAVMKQVFEENGIGVIHDTTVHDYPSYQGAYTRALSTIENNLKQNPSIKIVLDIHRDGYVYADGSKLCKTTTINGESVAQAMLVCGTDSMGLYHPQWRENLKLAAKIQSSAAQMYPSLMRSVDLRTERFNMHTTNGSLLIEIGANGNTLDEAKRCSKYVGEAICATIKQCY